MARLNNTSPVRTEEFHAPLYARDHPVGDQLQRKGRGGPDGHEIEHEPKMCPCCKEGK